MKNDSDKIPIKNIDEYLLNIPENQRLVLEELRQVIRETAPQAEEVISYGMPAFKYQGMLVYFAAFKKHCSFFAGNGSTVETLNEELKGYKIAKSTIQFTVEKPLPHALVEKIVKIRMKQNEDKMKVKNGKKTTNL
jgi:uncharacterized protein YdhG (YjbR/CyaY superfamily)